MMVSSVQLITGPFSRAVEDRTMRLPSDMNIISMGGGLGIERPRYLVRDRVGNEVNVAYHTEPMDMMMYGFDEKKYVVGSTIAVLYANSHYFMDETEGLRIEELATVKACSTRKDPHTNANSTAAHPELSGGTIERGPRSFRLRDLMQALRSGRRQAACMLQVQDQVLLRGKYHSLDGPKWPLTA